MNVTDLLAKLQSVRKTSKGWVARCPTHDDSNPSLSIGLARDGRILMHCHAGCPTETVVSELGMTLADLRPPYTPGNNDTPTKYRWTALAAANGKPIPTIHGALYVWHYKVRRWLRRKLGWFWWLYLAIFVFLIIKVLRK